MFNCRVQQKGFWVQSMGSGRMKFNAVEANLNDFIDRLEQNEVKTHESIGQSQEAERERTCSLYRRCLLLLPTEYGVVEGSESDSVQLLLSAKLVVGPAEPRRGIRPGLIIFLVVGLRLTTGSSCQADGKCK